MAIAIDKADAGTAANDAGSSSISVNTTQAVASGGFIVASISWWEAAGSISSVSGGGLTWTVGPQGKHSGDNISVGVVYAQAPSGLASGTTITANFSGAVNGRGIGISSFTGVATSSPVDVSGTVQSNSTNWTTGNLSVAAGSLVVGVASIPIDALSTITSPSIEAVDWGDGANFRVTTGYRIESSSGTVTVAGTWVPGSVTPAVGIAFLESAGGGPVWPPADTPPAPPLRVVRSSLRLT